LRPYEIRPRLERFYRLAAEADVPELTRLATTLETWWPAIQAYLALRITNARPEGYNRKIKQIKRVACGDLVVSTPVGPRVTGRMGQTNLTQPPHPARALDTCEECPYRSSPGRRSPTSSTTTSPRNCSSGRVWMRPPTSQC